MKRALCIWLPRWPVARLLLERPALSRKAVVLEEPRRGVRRVAACSAKAAVWGVCEGMPLAEAMSLAGPSSMSGESLHVEPYDATADRKGLEELAVWSARFSPIVGIEPVPAPECLFLDITGLEHLFGEESAQARRILEALGSRGLGVRIGVADTVGAAWAVARHGRKAESGKRKAEEGRSDGISMIAPGRTWAALDRLPVEALRLSDDVLGLLHSLGLYQVGQVRRLAREELVSRFGRQLPEHLDQADGRLAEPILAHGAPPELAAGWSLEHPVAQQKAIEVALEQLIGQVAQRLLRHGLGALRLACRLDCQSGPVVEFSVGLFQASASGEHLAGLVRMQLERLRITAPVVAIHVAAASTAALNCCQEELFADGTVRRRGGQLAGLVDRLSSRLGPRSVLMACLLAEAQPELAYRYDPVVKAFSGRRGRGSGSRSTAGSDELPVRPLRLVREPVAIEATSIMPDGPPLRFSFGGDGHTVARSWGPERIETGWWRGRAVGRDYYRVETTAGRRFWLFRRLRDRRWFLHGSFE